MFDTRPHRPSPRWSIATMTLVLLAGTAVVSAAQNNGGSISGTVADPLGNYVIGAKVTVSNDATGIVSTGTTSASSRFQFSNLPPGPYSVTITHPGFSETYLDVPLEPGQAVEHELAMRVGEVAETVRVLETGTRSVAPTERRGPQRLPGRETTPPPRACTSSCVTPPVKVFDVDPVYPPAAAARGIQGTVILEATIDARGEVSDVKVLKSVEPSLDRAAVSAVRQWEFVPTLLNGLAVDTLLGVTVEFVGRSQK